MFKELRLRLSKDLWFLAISLISFEIDGTNFAVHFESIYPKLVPELDEFMVETSWNPDILNEIDEYLCCYGFVYFIDLHRVLDSCTRVVDKQHEQHEHNT